jgi:pilus assembly protein CpaB
MRNLGFVLLIISVLLGGIAVWGVRNLTAARAAPGKPVGETSVVVASRPIGFGEVLTPEVLRVQAWPVGARPQGAFTTVAELTNGPRRVALGPIAASEPILPGRISGAGARASLSGVIRPGLRASTIRVNDVFGVAGFVLPGDIVDVLVTRSEGQRGSDTATMRTDVLLQSVRVLAVDQLANGAKNDPVVAKAATIEVTAEQAQKLALAAQVGTLSLALRGTADPLGTEEAPPRTVQVSDLKLVAAAPPRLVRASAPRPVRRARPGPTMEIYRAGAPTTVAVRHE